MFWSYQLPIKPFCSVFCKFWLKPSAFPFSEFLKNFSTICKSWNLLNWLHTIWWQKTLCKQIHYSKALSITTSKYTIFYQIYGYGLVCCILSYTIDTLFGGTILNSTELCKVSYKLEKLNFWHFCLHFVTQNLLNKMSKSSNSNLSEILQGSSESKITLVAKVSSL